MLFPAFCIQYRILEKIPNFPPENKSLTINDTSSSNYRFFTEYQALERWLSG